MQHTNMCLEVPRTTLTGLENHDRQPTADDATLHERTNLSGLLLLKSLPMFIVHSMLDITNVNCMLAITGVNFNRMLDITGVNFHSMLDITGVNCSQYVGC